MGKIQKYSLWVNYFLKNLNNKNQKDGAGDGTLSANNSLEDTSGLVDLGAIAETYYITPNGVNISV